MEAWETQLRRGVVDLAVLARLAGGEAYGYQVLAQLREHAGLDFPESTVYPALTRLAREGLLAVRVEASPSGPPRRYYRLTAAGRHRLGEMADSLRRVAGSITTLLQGGDQR